MKILFVALLLFYFSKLIANDPCKRCDIDKVAIANEYLDSLNIEIVKDFLCTFDSTCINNAEYSEWSNEVLFKVLEKSPTIFIKAVVDPQVNSKQIIREIERPIYGGKYQIIYDKIKTTNISIKIKTKYLDALIKGAASDDVKINR